VKDSVVSELEMVAQVGSRVSGLPWLALWDLIVVLAGTGKAGKTTWRGVSESKEA
jgi:hypothetical protein